MAKSGSFLSEIVLIPNGPYIPAGLLTKTEFVTSRTNKYGVSAFKGFPSVGISKYRYLSSPLFCEVTP